MKKEVFRNAVWIIGCKIVQSACSFVIGAFTARYLGPSNYGLISYATSIVAFFVPIMQLGFSSTLVREIIDRSENEGQVLGTALVFNVISSFACVIGVATFSVIVTPSQRDTIIVCILYSLILVFQAAEVTQYWFQAKLLSKYSSIVSLIVYFIVSLYKIYILVDGKTVGWFAVTHVIEAAMIASVLMVIYFKSSKQKLSFSMKLGKEMFLRSRHYIGPAMMVIIFQHTDQLMLKWMVGETVTGYYAASITCVGILGFVFTAIISSFRPVILESRKKSEQEFKENIVVLYSIVSILSIAQSIGMTVFARLFVGIIFGDTYLSAAPMLRIAVWSVGFGHFGSVRNIWILAENQQRHLWKINLSGAILNVILNFILIPIADGRGAAIATLVTQIFTNLIIGFFIKPIRSNNELLLKSFSPRILFNVFKKILPK